jgi:hypothetical protein
MLVCHLSVKFHKKYIIYIFVGFFTRKQIVLVNNLLVIARKYCLFKCAVNIQKIIQHTESRILSVK